MFSTNYYVSNIQFDWVGPSNLNWSLDPGTYWVAFEVRSRSTFDGRIGGDAPDPLINEALATANSGYVYWGIDFLDSGMQINATPVPLPSSILLLVSGLSGLGLFSWRKRQD